MDEQPNYISLGEDIEQAWLRDDRILVFRMHSNSRTVVDHWAKKVLEVGENYSDKPYLALYDIRSFKFYMSVTPYVQQKVAEVGRAQANIKGRYAFVVNKSPVLQLWQSFLSHSVKALQPKLEGQIFFDWDEALAWLCELT